MLNIKILTIFPELFPGPLGISLAGQALKKKLWNLETINIKDFAEDKHSSIDDKPFGGGNGMVMRPDILEKAIEHAKLGFKDDVAIFYMSPRGKKFSQQIAKEIVGSHSEIVIICGRFEGIDERIIDYYKITEISLGDFVLSGGEIAAITMIDACLRLIPGIIGKEDVHKEESFGEGEYENLLEYPQYTRPAKWNGLKVPEILTSGNHQKIADWRLQKATELTKKTRPDLFN